MAEKTARGIVIVERLESDTQYKLDSVRLLRGQDGRYVLDSVVVHPSVHSAKEDVESLKTGQRKQMFVKINHMEQTEDKSLALLLKSVCEHCRDNLNGTGLNACICSHERIYDVSDDFTDKKGVDHWLGNPRSLRWKFYHPVTFHKPDETNGGNRDEPKPIAKKVEKTFKKLSRIRSQEALEISENTGKSLK